MVDYNWQWPGQQSPTDPMGLVNPRGGPSDVLSMQLLRAQFEDWQKTFEPIELQQMNELSFNNPDVLPTALTDADRAATGSFGAMSNALDVTNRELGVAPTENQQEGTRRLMGMNQALATAGAENKARAGVRAQDEAILMGSMPNPNVMKAA